MPQLMMIALLAQLVKTPLGLASTWSGERADSPITQQDPTMGTRIFLRCFNEPGSQACKLMLVCCYSMLLSPVTSVFLGS